MGGQDDPVRESVQDQPVSPKGRLAGQVDGGQGQPAVLSGRVAGELDRAGCSLRGEFTDGVSIPGKGSAPKETLKLHAVLEPRRAIHFTQYVKGKAVGGVTVTVQSPGPSVS